MNIVRHRRWQDWFCYLVEQGKALEQKYPEWIDMTEPGDAADRFAEFHEATDLEVRKSVRRFAATGNWPEMSPAVGAMIRLRLSGAADFAMALAFARARLPLRRSYRHWLKWFLIEVWEHVSFGDIHGSYENLRRDGDTGKLPKLSCN